MRNLKLNKWVLAALVMLMIPFGATMAQETSASMNGTIVDSDGNPLSGAEVTVRHEPTGQVKTATTADGGRYSFRGLRVGGPYVIEVSKGGFSTAEEGNIFIKLGEDRAINAVLVEDAISLDTVKAVGVAAQSAVFNPDNMGSGSNFTQEQITNLPTVDRDIQDYVRLDSRVNILDFGRGISVSGVNNRFNNISIDGVSIKDPFGLEAGNSPGISQPFSLDTIEELNVQLSPYDVTLGDFTGANINAVTKSGTNEFSGRVAVYYGDEDFQREDDDPFTNEVYSLSVGGPIIKDKLFFFLAYEKEERSTVADSSGVDVSEAQQVANVASNVWGMAPGTLEAPGDVVTEEESVLLKLDWNINDYHRASFKYQQNEDMSPRFTNGSGEISFSSNWYNVLYDNESMNLNLYSDWTPNFSTELRVSTSEFDKDPGINARYPEVAVEVDSGTVYLGTEQNRHANYLNVKTDNFYFQGNYFLGDHEITFGTDWRQQDIYNVYIRHAFGTYEFDSLDDFQAGTPSYYTFNQGVDPSNPYPAANWSWENMAFFVQDNWRATDRLTMQFGLRYDEPSVDDKPRFNQDFMDAFGFANNNVMDSGVWQPRIGFNYDMSDERYMQLRGGVGLFTGGTPNVWVSNSFSNTGGDTVNYSYFGGGDAIFSPDVNNQPVFAGRSTQNVDVLAPDFKIPTVLKSNIAVDVELPWYGLIASAELEYIKNRDAVLWQHLNLGEPTGTLPDGRFSYYEDPYNLDGRRANRNTDFNDIIYLSSDGKGETKRATFSLELPQTENWSAKASYTFTDAKDTGDADSSTSYSSWQYTNYVNPNEGSYGTSAYEIENAFTMFVNYRKIFFGDTYTNIGLVWISRDGEPYSYRWNNDVNGDGSFYNDLLYVPNPDEYVLTDGNVEDFEAYLASTGLDQYRGQIAPRNGFKTPRINRWDINVSQELPAWGPVRATLFFNIKNLGNLIDSDWGHSYTGFYRGEGPYSLDGITEEGIYEIDFGRTPYSLSKSFVPSQWRAQLGFRLDW
ncbi:MAG: TonB-dependent receptor domain-containing protein [Marinicella pacifica]